METATKELIDVLDREHKLSGESYIRLLDAHGDDETRAYAAKKANVWREKIYGKEVFVRGLIEFTNICKNNCLYCGIRRDNREVPRYRLSEDEIVACADEGYELGFRTVVLQGGEDSYYDDRRMCDIIKRIKAQHPDSAVTLSLGERDRASYEAMYNAGADRYLLRHETADRAHYEKLHPQEMSYDNRMRCLRDLKEIGYQVGCGFMVGSPFQTHASLAQDLLFVQEFHPAMCGIGPFLPHHDTPFADEEKGSYHLTLFLISLLRLIQPDLLLPATTALGTIHPRGREMGILAGGNVVMPNLSPVRVRKQYELYDNKICTGDESAQCRHCLDMRMDGIGYQVVVARGDYVRGQYA